MWFRFCRRRCLPLFWACLVPSLAAVALQLAARVFHVARSAAIVTYRRAVLSVAGSILPFFSVFVGTWLEGVLSVVFGVASCRLLVLGIRDVLGALVLEQFLDLGLELLDFLSDVVVLDHPYFCSGVVRLVIDRLCLLVGLHPIVIVTYRRAVLSVAGSILPFFSVFVGTWLEGVLSVVFGVASCRLLVLGIRDVLGALVLEQFLDLGLELLDFLSDVVVLDHPYFCSGVVRLVIDRLCLSVGLHPIVITDYG